MVYCKCWSMGCVRTNFCKLLLEKICILVLEEHNVSEKLQVK